MHNEIGRSSKLKYKRDTDIRMTCLSKHKKSTKRSNSQRTRTSFKQASYTKKLIHKNQTKGLVLKNAGIPELSKTIFLPKWLADNRVEFILGNWIGENYFLSLWSKTDIILPMSQNMFMSNITWAMTVNCIPFMTVYFFLLSNFEQM